MHARRSLCGFAAATAVIALAAAACGPAASGPKQPGAHPKRTAASNPAPQPSAPKPAAPDWTTYHGANTRWGSYPEPSAVGLRAAWTTPALDGAVYAEPVWEGRTVYVATENDTVYAVDLQSGNITWRRHLGSPVPRSDLPCGNIDPLGITGTPVIASGRLYVAAEIMPLQHRLFALSLTTGDVLGSWSLDLPGSHAAAQQQRGALTYLGGTVYVPLGGLYGDCGPYVGQVAAVRPGSAPFGYRVPTAREGGIWAAGGLSVGTDGFLYAATGNSASNAAWDGGDSVLRLSPDLKLHGFFTPSDYVQRNLRDLDLGSTTPLPLPGDRMFQIGKAGIGYLLEPSSLGGVGHAVFAAPVCAGAYGADAYDGTFVYVPCTNGLVALRVTHSGFSVAWRSSGWYAGPPAAGGGSVFSVNESTGRLMVLKAATGKVLAGVPLGAGVPHFDSPALAPGLVLVAGKDRVLAYALR